MRFAFIYDNDFTKVTGLLLLEAGGFRVERDPDLIRMAEAWCAQ